VTKPVNKPVGLANLTYDSEGDGFWMVTEEAIDQTHLATAEPDPMLGASNIFKVTLHREEKVKIQLGEKEWITAVIIPIEGNNHICIELCNLGATWHITSYRSDFTTYSPLTPPIFLNTANQQRFLAIRCGMLAIQVPNRDTEKEPVLHGMLHTPAVGCTLISVAALDEEGYHAHIGTGHLEFTLPQGECIGHIPWTQGCLYKVVHTSESANAIESMSLMELHRHLGHVAPLSAHKLVQSGAITRIELDPDS
jgi:hypothetical protein